MPVPRFQLFELEDLSWFPRTIRDLATDYLQFMETRLALHKHLGPLLRAALNDARTVSVIDVCSGGSGPVLGLYESLCDEYEGLSFTLTDRFPNLHAFRRLATLHPDGLRFVESSVDATNVANDLVGLRTMFNAFHHFEPESAQQVLRNAVEAGQPIGIFDVAERGLLRMIPLFFNPILVVLATPFIRPFRWQRLLWTYAVPLVPLTCWWDGLVSACRAYTVEEMMAMTETLSGYEWRADRVRIYGSAGHLSYLIGIPRIR